jgi:hypothetical protein
MLYLFDYFTPVKLYRVLLTLYDKDTLNDIRDGIIEMG